MRIAQGVTGRHSFDVLQNVATIGFEIELPPDSRGFDKVPAILDDIMLSFEIVSSVNAENKVLFRDITMHQVARLTSVGATLMSVSKEGYLYVNVPVCLEGALVFDKTTFLRVTVNTTSEMNLYAIGSLTYGQQPIRIQKNTIRANEDAKINLTGSSVIGYYEDAPNTMRFHSAVGAQFELKSDEHQFVVNALGDFFYTDAVDGKTVIVDKGFVTLPTTLAHKVDVEQGSTESIYYLFYENYAVADEVKCNC